MEPSQEAIAAIAAVTGGDTARLDELLAADPTLAYARDEMGVSVLMQALYHRQTEAARRLLRTGMKLDLFEAASLGRVERVEELANAETVGAFSSDGFTALHFAAFFGQPEAIEVLLRHRPALNLPARNAMAVAPLNSAVASGSAGSVALLVAAGADVDFPQRGGFTPLMGAAFAGNEEMVEILLAAGADPTLTNAEGQSAAQLAEAQGHPGLAMRLQ